MFTWNFTIFIYWVILSSLHTHTYNVIYAIYIYTIVAFLKLIQFIISISSIQLFYTDFFYTFSEVNRTEKVLWWDIFEYIGTVIFTNHPIKILHFKLHLNCFKFFQNIYIYIYCVCLRLVVIALAYIYTLYSCVVDFWIAIMSIHIILIYEHIQHL